MKRLLCVIFSCALYFYAEAQVPIEVSFQGPPYLSYMSFGFDQPGESNYIAIDSSQSGNIWQIGQPQKAVFSSALYGPTSIVTDMANVYPTSNESSFEIRIINYYAYLCTTLQIYHSYETTAGLDGGTIEVSHDQGQTWINIASDSLFLFDMTCGFGTPPYSLNDTVEALGKPGFSGSSNGMQLISLTWMPTYSFQHDTIDLRFTFASDSIAENKDGWMLDAFMIGAIGEGIQTPSEHVDVVYTPNPSNGMVHMRANSSVDKKEISIYNSTGTQVASFESAETEFNWSFLPEGMYEVRTRSEGWCSTQRILIVH